MPKFEVHIPAAEAGGFAMTLKVGADNWMAALKAGMAKLGEQGSSVQNVLVDIQEDNSIHVTESRSGRVFRIRELSEEEAAKAPLRRPSQIRAREAMMAAQRAQADAGKTQPALPAYRPDEPTVKGSVLKEDSGAAQRADARTAPVRRPGNKSSPRIEVERLQIEELEHPTKPVTAPIGRKKTGAPAAKETPPAGGPIEDVLADVFMRVQEIQNKRPEEALYFILDLALEKVPADAGSVLGADGASGDLTFLAARGPKAKELLGSKITIPAGTGFAGFCAAEGVSVAVSDVDKDPRYYGQVAEKVDYETKSLLCAPMMTHGRSFGCLQLINRKSGPHFQEHEVGILSYLAHQAALFLNERG